MISSARLAGMRRRFTDRLTDRCTIERATTPSDGAGGRTTTYAAVATNEPCYAYPATREGAEQIVGQRVQSENEWVVLVRHDLEVLDGDHIVVNGLTLDVSVGVSTGRSLEVLRRVPCVKVG